MIDESNGEMTLSDYDGNVSFESLQHFQCKTFGKSFYNETGNSYSATRPVTCQWDRRWQPETIAEPCRWSHCINPPQPESRYNLKLLWNDKFPPAHNETVMFACWAGNNWNRFEDDFAQWNFTVPCREENQFEAVPAWPQCLDSEFNTGSHRSFL